MESLAGPAKLSTTSCSTSGGQSGRVRHRRPSVPRAPRSSRVHHARVGRAGNGLRAASAGVGATRVLLRRRRRLALVLGETEPPAPTDRLAVRADQDEVHVPNRRRTGGGAGAGGNARRTRARPPSDRRTGSRRSGIEPTGPRRHCRRMRSRLDETADDLSCLFVSTASGNRMWSTFSDRGDGRVVAAQSGGEPRQLSRRSPGRPLGFEPLIVAGPTVGSG